MNPGPSETSARNSRVFIVDDHPLVREGLTNLINGQDDLFVCGEAKDSAQAINGIAKARPDVALIDISLTNEPRLTQRHHSGIAPFKLAIGLNH
jgi:DNA-binding NarL/FixJ family response regulator